METNFRWILMMAWRDTRRNHSRLLLFISSIVLGIAALTATFSLGENAQKDIDLQAKSLVGADLSIGGDRIPGADLLSKFKKLGDQRAEERTFASMIYFTKSADTRLVQVHALEGGYPFYGELSTSPASASLAFRNRQEALVDKTLMLQYQAQIGDSIKIGELCFAIAGALDKAPGRNGISLTVAPPVYIPLAYLGQTGLLKRGSRISYDYYFKFNHPVNIEASVQPIEAELEKAGMGFETVESRKRNTGRAFSDFDQFLTLISFIALLLGSIGVGSAINIYVREKIGVVATLHCLGARTKQTFLIFLIQVAGIGLIGSILGTILGLVVQQVFPIVLRDFLPIELTTSISWRAVGKGLALGVVISILFAMLPLLAIRKVSPLYALRLYVEKKPSALDLTRMIIYLAIFWFIVWFSWKQIHSFPKALTFALSVLGGFALLYGVAWSLRWMVRRFFPRSWSYVWRQAFANLYRPNNQTVILTTTIGMGTAFIGILYFVHTILLGRVAISGVRSEPNMVLFDIQNNQKDSVIALAKSFKLPLLDELPVVPMHIEDINGVAPESYRPRDTFADHRRRSFESEIRVTYRDSLVAGEELITGKLGSPIRSPADTTRISVEEQYASRARIKKGDHIDFDIQGTTIKTVVGSIRKVDWRSMPTNFRIVFPSGALDEAPQFHVLITRVPSELVSAKFQQNVIRRFPTVSIIDLGLILRVLDEVLSKIALVIRFMAGFSILTGVIVLFASVLISKYQRMQESVLLRTLGASRKQILAITGLEYFFLGSLAAATGILLSLLATWALAKFSLDAVFSPNWLPVILLFLFVCLLTVVIGLVNSRDVLYRPPLEVLRKEV